jgi:hypothetical protein
MDLHAALERCRECPHLIRGGTCAKSGNAPIRGISRKLFITEIERCPLDYAKKRNKGAT